MGSTNFFSKLASADPLAQALNLPGAHKYAQAQAQDVQTNPGPYAGQTPTLAAANAGYAPGSTAQGATPGWTPNQATSPGNAFFGLLQKAANVSGNVTPHLNGPASMPTTPNFSSGNPYVQAARGAAQQNQWGA
jgi:hypothetical protein